MSTMWSRVFFTVTVLSISFLMVQVNFVHCDGIDDESGEVQQKLTTKNLLLDKKQTSRRASDSKFKFHKIERIYVDSFVEDETDAYSDDEGGIDYVGKDNKQTNKAKTEGKTRTKIGSNKFQSNEQVNRDTEPTFFGNIMDMLTGKHKVNVPKYSSNNIISWLQWLGEQVAGDRPVEKVQHVSAIDSSLFTYLNRWPFNIILPDVIKNVEPQVKPQITNDHNKGGGAETTTAMPDEYFELLLHSLPTFIANFSDVKMGNCHQHLQIWHRQMRSYKLWTLQMLDATGKVSSGLLRGHINQFGDFDLCTQAVSVVKVAPGNPKRIQGKYCLAQIETRTKVSSLKVPLHMLHGFGLWQSHINNPKQFVPRYTVANWGICVPDACSVHVVHDILATSLRPYNSTGVEFLIKVEEDACSLRLKRNVFKLLWKDTKFGLSVLAITTLGVICLIALLWEKRKWIRANVFRHDSTSVSTVQSEYVVLESKDQTQSQEIESSSRQPSYNFLTVLHSVLNEFSPIKTFQSLVSLECPDVDFPFFHFIRILAVFLLYVSLKFIMVGHLPITNRESLVETVNGYWSLTFRLPLLYSDALLLISGFLAAYQLSLKIEKKTQIRFVKNVAMRACRYLPSLYAVLCFQTWILPHLGAGPLWNQLVGESARVCEQHMWRPALSLQNSVNFEESCSPLAVSLSLELQLYILGPLIVWLFYTDAEAAFFIYGALHAISIAMRYSRSSREHLAPSLFHGIHVSKFYRTANLIYASPLSRATAYLLGIGAALLYRSENGVFVIARRFITVGWATAFLATAWCFWTAAPGMRSEFVYNSADAASYLAWSPLIMGLVVCWCIFMLPQRLNMWQSMPSVAQAVLFLSRIAFPLQLTTYLVVLWNTASVKEAQTFQVTNLMDVHEMCAILILAIVVAFLIDIPMRQMRRSVIDYIFKERLTEEEPEPTPVAISEAPEREEDEPEEKETEEMETEEKETAELENEPQRNKQENNEDEESEPEETEPEEIAPEENIE